MANPLILPGIGSAKTPFTPSPASLGRYLILYAYYYGVSPAPADQLVLTINPGPNYGKVAYPVFQASGSANGAFVPFFPFAGGLPPRAAAISEAMGNTGGFVAGNACYNGLAGWVSPLRTFTSPVNYADQYMALSVDTLLSATPLAAYPKTRTTSPVGEPYLTLTINSTAPENLYTTMFAMCATVTSLEEFLFYTDMTAPRLGLIVTETDFTGGGSGDLYNDATMNGGVYVPPGFVTRTEYDTGTEYTPDVYSETSQSNPYTDVAAFLNGSDMVAPLTLGMNSLKFNVH